MAALTFTEAAARSASISVDRYDVELDLTLGAQFFAARTTVEFTSRDRQPTFLDIQPQSLHSVRLNGARLDVDTWRDGRLRLEPDQHHNVVEVEATMAYSNDGEGLHRYVDPVDKQAYLYAMCFLSAAPRIFACFDQPDLKAPYHLGVRTPDDWIVLGNGPATSTATGRWSITQDLPLATYFVTLVAGPYHLRTREYDGIRIGLACRASLAPHLDRDADEMFRVTGQSFDEFHRLFGIRYPFGEYHQAFVPEFNAGAMENPGCVTLRDQFIFDSVPSHTERASRARVIAHEMAHQWFGDLVTMRWWNDLWLNESFAEYMAYRVCAEVTDFDDSWLEFSYSRKPWGISADQRQSTHPVAGVQSVDAEAALDNFDGISYAKGTAVLKQLVAFLGDDAFLTGVREHLTTHAYGNATFDDITASWAAACGEAGLDAWLASWLRTAGIDTLEARETDNGHRIVVTSASPDRPRPHTVQVARFGADVESARVTVVDGVSVPLSSSPGFVLPDAADDTWAKIRLDERSVGELPELLGRVPDPVARSVMWASVRESMFDAIVDPEYVLTVTERVLAGEPVDLAVESVLALLETALGRYLVCADATARLEALTARLLSTAEPGSNRQLVAARAYLGVTTDSTSITRWLGGHGPDGLLLSTDLGWRVLYRLIRNGAAGAGAIDELLEREPSDSAQIWSSRSRAAIPDPVTKEEVWQRIATDPDISNHRLYALCEGFWQVDQGELTAPYVDRFFDEIGGTADFRSGWIVGHSAGLAFPRFAATPHTLDRGERLAEDTSLPSGVRRSIADENDELRRVVTCQQKFGGSGPKSR